MAYILKANDQVVALRSSGKTDEDIVREDPECRLDQYTAVDLLGTQYLATHYGFTWYTIEHISNCLLTVAQAASLRRIQRHVEEKRIERGNFDTAEIERELGDDDLFQKYYSPCKGFWRESSAGLNLDLVLFLHSREGKKYFSANLNREILYTTIKNQEFQLYNTNFFCCLCLFKDKVIQHFLDKRKLTIEQVLTMSDLFFDSFYSYDIPSLRNEMLHEYQGRLTGHQLVLMQVFTSSSPDVRNFSIKYATKLLLYWVRKEIDPIVLKQLYDQKGDWYLLFTSKIILLYFDAGRLDWHGFLKMMEKIEALCTDDIWKGVAWGSADRPFSLRFNLFSELIRSGILTPDHVNRLTPDSMSSLLEGDVLQWLVAGWITMDDVISCTPS